MKTLFGLLCVFGVALCPVCGQGAKGLNPAKGLQKEASRIGLRGEILQVLDEGLLMDGGSSSWLLVKHPRQKVLTDGVVVNCYVRRLKRNYEYTDTAGSKRTVPVYEFAGERSGK
jgi:hypothetical protein